MELTGQLCKTLNQSYWRQSKLHIRNLKSVYRSIQSAKRSSKSGGEEKIKSLHKDYIHKSNSLLKKISSTFHKLTTSETTASFLKPHHLVLMNIIEKYMGYAKLFIDLIERRVLKGETIPHSEKIFSIFEDYTRWISKGKAGVMVEFGVPVTILKDQYGYILENQIMFSGSDVDVLQSLVERTLEQYPHISSLSSDKGFWSPGNYEALKSKIRMVVMPKKGYLNKLEKERESSADFKKLRRHHSSVESSINGLNHSGLDKCLDRSRLGFEKYVNLSILARNIFTLGKQLREQEAKRLQRKPYTKAA